VKIRTQFYVLIAGVVVVPVLAVAGFWLLQRAQDDAYTYPVPDYEEISRLSAGAILPDEWAELSEFISRRKPDMDFIVLSPENRVVYSSTEDAAAGTELSAELLLRTIRDTSDRYLYIVDSPVRLENPGALVLMRLDQHDPGPPKPFYRLFIYFGLMLGAIFLFSSAMAVLIARSITRSVTTLEEATRRIAAGELDVAVDARGSNEITSLTASLNRMRLALKEEEARRARFIMGVSHDLKTPLALIKGYAEAIGDGMADDPESLAGSVGIIAAKVDQLEGMIDDLIDFVKVDTGEWRLKLGRVVLSRFLGAYAHRVSADAELLGRRVECGFDIPDDLAVPMDERLALRALENLVNNALRYTAPGGLVRISARLESASRAVIEISDDGPGMAADELKRIFDPFYRGSSSRREQGMGLGLSVVKGVVDSHGWSISVASEPGTGSSFRIVIPVGA
jgi:signal transduction histidine kinase